MNIEKLYTLGLKNASIFKDIADKVVENYVTGTDEMNKKKISGFVAIDMAMGAELKKTEHVLTGVGIGVVGTALAFTIGNKIKNRKKKDEVVVEFDMDTLNTMEEVLKDQKQTFEEEAAASETEEVEETQDDVEESILDKVHDILKKPSNLEDLKAVIEELRNNEK